VQAIVVRGVSEQAISLIQQSDDVEAVFPDLKVRVPDGMAPVTMDLMSVSAGELAFVLALQPAFLQEQNCTTQQFLVSRVYQDTVCSLTMQSSPQQPQQQQQTTTHSSSTLLLKPAILSVACSTALCQRSRNQCRRYQ
jgi:hypothetical protein